MAVFLADAVVFLLATTFLLAGEGLLRLGMNRLSRSDEPVDMLPLRRPLLLAFALPDSAFSEFDLGSVAFFLVDEARGFGFLDSFAGVLPLGFASVSLSDRLISSESVALSFPFLLGSLLACFLLGRALLAEADTYSSSSLSSSSDVSTYCFFFAAAWRAGLVNQASFGSLNIAEGGRAYNAGPSGVETEGLSRMPEAVLCNCDEGGRAVEQASRSILPDEDEADGSWFGKLEEVEEVGCGETRRDLDFGINTSSNSGLGADDDCVSLAA